MVGIACWQVVSRYILVFPAPLPKRCCDFSRCGYHVGHGFVAGQKQHISLTLLLDKVSPTIRGWWDIILQVILSRFPFGY